MDGPSGGNADTQNEKCRINLLSTNHERLLRKGYCQLTLTCKERDILETPNTHLPFDNGSSCIFGLFRWTCGVSFCFPLSIFCVPSVSSACQIIYTMHENDIESTEYHNVIKWKRQLACPQLMIALHQELFMKRFKDIYHLDINYILTFLSNYSDSNRTESCKWWIMSFHK